MKTYIVVNGNGQVVTSRYSNSPQVAEWMLNSDVPEDRAFAQLDPAVIEDVRNVLAQIQQA